MDDTTKQNQLLDQTPQQSGEINTTTSGIAMEKINLNSTQEATKEQKEIEEGVSPAPSVLSPLMDILNVLKKKVIVIVAVVVGLFLLYAIIAFAIDAMSTKAAPPIKEVEEPEQTTEKPPVEEIPNFYQVINKQYEFEFEYPNEAKYFENNPYSLDPSTYKVVFSKENPNTDTLDETNIVDGYMFRLVVDKAPLTKDLTKLAEDKQLVFKAKCQESVEISKPESTKITGFDAIQFSITNCYGGDYVQTFVNREDFVFDVTRFVVGDLGFKQRYQATVNNIYNDFKFTNTIEPSPVTTWVEYVAKSKIVAFKHPSYDANCCDISGPIKLNPQKEPTKLVVLADPNTVDENNKGKPFNGFGIYLENVGSTGFNEYLEQQKQALKENYRIIIGRNPNSRETKVLIDGREAILLENYAWWADVIVIPPAEKELETILIFKTEIAESAFDETFREILNTMIINPR